jgi:hypothetical protein
MNKNENEKMKNEKMHCIIQQLQIKLSSYKQQDVQKSIYDVDQFIDITTIIQLLIENKLICHYCKNTVKVLYEYVRDPMQWTLDRIDNTFGHNKQNVLLACLNCNIRRKTIYHKKYEFTKECANVIKLA